MHHIVIYLDNGQILTKNQNSIGIGHKKLWISTENGRGITKRGNEQKNWKIKLLTVLTRWSTRPGLVDRFVGIGVFKWLPCFSFCTILLHFFKVSLILASRLIWVRFGLIKCFGLAFWEDWRLGFQIWAAFSSFTRHSQLPLHFHTP